MPLKPCQRPLRNAVVPRRTPGYDTPFTIRAWSLRAVSRSESAPVSVTTAVICLLSSGGEPNSLVTKDQMDVSSLSRGVMSPVGSTPIHPITEWPSLPPASSYLHNHPPSLRLGDSGTAPESHTGLPRSADVPGWVRPRLFAEGAPSATGELGAPVPDPLPFGPSLSAPLACRQ